MTLVSKMAWIGKVIGGNYVIRLLMFLELLMFIYVGEYDGVGCRCLLKLINSFIQLTM